MKSIIILMVLVGLCTINGFGQYKYDYHYVCGYGSRSGQADPIFNFNADTLSIKHERLKLGMDACNSTMSDENGNLLYYFNGCGLANKNHEIIEGGSGFNAGVEAAYYCPDNSGYPTGQQSALSLPAPGYPDQYLIFHNRIRVYQINDSIVFYYDLNFSSIDMKKNGGKGKVIKKNIPVLKDTIIGSGNMAAVKHANGYDWWVIHQDYIYDNNYYKILVKKDSVIEYSHQRIGINFKKGGQGGGQASFSPDGSKYMTFSADDGLFVMDFDRKTALFSNFVHLKIEMDGLFNGASFSPNGRFIYLSDRLYLYQVDLMDTILKAELIAEWDGFREPFLNRGTVFGPMQTGPDCRIYVSTGSCIKYWHIIMKPDEKGKACEVKQHALEFNTSICNIPYFPNYRLDTGIPYCNPEKIVITGVADLFSKTKKWEDVRIFPNPGDGNITIESSVPCRIEMYDITGQLKMNNSAYETSILADIAPLNDGLYIVKCITQGGIVDIQKFLKQ